MVSTWTVDVVGHFFLVLFILVLLSSATAWKNSQGWEYKVFMVSVTKSQPSSVTLLFYPTLHPAPHTHANTFLLRTFLWVGLSQPVSSGP